MNRLLIVACSQRKNPATGLLPAIKRYDGPIFRVLRKYLRERPEDAVHVLILSAKHGLIGAEHAIQDYDCRFSRASAVKLRPQVLKTACAILQAQAWQAVGICAGKDYQIALAGLPELVTQNVRVEFIQGGQGSRLTALHQWLRGGE